MAESSINIPDEDSERNTDLRRCKTCARCNKPCAPSANVRRPWRAPRRPAPKPNEPPLEALRSWVGRLEQAVEKEDRTVIHAVLKDAVPEFGNGHTSN